MTRLVILPHRGPTGRVARIVGALILAASCRSAKTAEQASLGSVRLTSTCVVPDTSHGNRTVVGAATGPAPTGGNSSAAAAGEICAMLDRAASNWNRGDLDAFMSDYLPGDQTTYIGKNGVLHGPDAIRRVYAPRFGPGGVRDSLSFENLEVDLLATDVANAIAYYVLSRGDSTVARGPTSLVMRRIGGRWRIVHDHSS